MSPSYFAWLSFLFFFSQEGEMKIEDKEGNLKGNTFRLVDVFMVNFYLTHAVS